MAARGAGALGDGGEVSPQVTPAELMLLERPEVVPAVSIGAQDAEHDVLDERLGPQQQLRGSILTARLVDHEDHELGGDQRPEPRLGFALSPARLVGVLDGCSGRRACSFFVGLRERLAALPNSFVQHLEPLAQTVVGVFEVAGYVKDDGVRVPGISVGGNE